MKKRCFCRFIVPISLVSILILLLLSACRRPEILIDVNLDEKGNVVFSGYYERIRKESNLRREVNAFFMLHVTEDSCVQGECDRIVWHVASPYAYSENPLKTTIVLPEFITYGQSISKSKEKIKAEPLKRDVPYFIQIGFRAINKDLSDEIRIVAGVHFMLTKDKNSANIIKQSGKDGVRLKRVIIE